VPRPQLKIVETMFGDEKFESKNGYLVILRLSRPMSVSERRVVEGNVAGNPLGVSTNPNEHAALYVHDTTIEQVAEARDELKALVQRMESEGAQYEQTAKQSNIDRTEEKQRRREIAASIDWD
jgi:hypothetical protein